MLKSESSEQHRQHHEGLEVTEEPDLEPNLEENGDKSEKALALELENLDFSPGSTLILSPWASCFPSMGLGYRVYKAKGPLPKVPFSSNIL